MMLEHLGFAEAAERLDSALARIYAEGCVLTPDQGGSASTTEFCDAVASLI
jgi:isocitrate/isopropylmalate dehydrogenase